MSDAAGTRTASPKPTLLITGGSGLLALNWALVVRDKWSVVLGVHERDVSMAGVGTRRIDLASVDGLVRALEDIRPQVVVHTAGLTSVEQCEGDPELAHHVNVTLATNVATACARHGCSLVHISTDHLFPGEAACVDERSPTAPQNVYGKTKAEAELRVLEAHGSALVVRTNFYGWGPSYRRSFSDAIIRALRSGIEVTLFEDVFYTPILIAPAVLAVHELVDRRASGVFHVTGDIRLSKHDFGQMLAREFGLDSRLIRAGTLADSSSLVRRPHDMSLSNDKASRLLGRKLGGVPGHVAELHSQERSGLNRELTKI